MAHYDFFANKNIEEILALLNSPKEDIFHEVRCLLKDQLATVSDRWLLTGLLDYFFRTSSKRVLDILIVVPEPHDKHLLEKISEGLKSGDRFRYLSLLLYAVSQNPPALWIHKTAFHNVIKDLLYVLSPSRETDITVLVTGVMLLVVLLPTMPLDLSKYINKIFDCFWGLVHWTAVREQDETLKPYLQVAVYTLFHRLYALFPCNLTAYMRNNLVGQTRKSWFLNTLRPMFDRVRLHPFLITENKETEVSKSRWVGLQTNDLIQECAKICLDPLQEICEEASYDTTPNSQDNYVGLSDNSNFILYSSENSFWSPGVVQSPSSVTDSVPHTPVYALQLLSKSSGIAESPPETAVEATPETTPFTSPNPYLSPSKFDPRLTNSNSGFIQRSQRVKSADPTSDSCLEGKSLNSPLSPNKIGLPFKFPQLQGQEMVVKYEKSHLHARLQQIQNQREERQKDMNLFIESKIIENKGSSEVDVSGKNELQAKEATASNEFIPNTLNENKVNPNVPGVNLDGCRRRKVAVYDKNTSEEFQVRNDLDLFSEESEQYEKLGGSQSSIDQKSFDEDFNTEQSRKYSEASSHEGLGVPSHHSFTEFVKNVKTNRLRFLSQCGPPPNLALLSVPLSKGRVLSSKSSNLSYSMKQRSKSVPNISNESHFTLPVPAPKRDTMLKLLSLSPTKPLVETFEASTQTEEIQVVDPYEQLLKALIVPEQRHSKEEKEPFKMSPHYLLDQFIKHGCSSSYLPVQEFGWNSSEHSENDVVQDNVRSLHSIMMLERYKREVHAERNRRLLGKIKKLHLLQEREIGLRKEIREMKEEISKLHNHSLKVQEQAISYEKKVNEMVSKERFVETHSKALYANQQREHLREMCATLQKEKFALTEDLQNCRGSVRECQRQLKVHAKHSNENELLHKQIEYLNKKLLIVGEIQVEMHHQVQNYKESQRQAQITSVALERNVFNQKIKELEMKNKADTTSLEAALFRIKQLEEKLMLQHKASLNHQKEIQAVASSWKERCDALDKRNHELCSINITLESQMQQLLRWRPERESDDSSEARRLVPATGREGFSAPFDVQHFLEQLPTEEPSSFIARASTDNFRPIRSPRFDE